MNHFTINTKLKLLVAYNIGEVLHLILTAILQETEKIKEVILLIARYNDLNRDAKMERLEREEISIEMNKIRLSIMDFLEEATPEELDYENIEKALIQEDQFNKIIKEKITHLDFRGMFNSKPIESKTLDFDWKTYFLPSDTESIVHFPALTTAFHLLETKFDLPLTDFSSSSLVAAAIRLRQTTKGAAIQWEFEGLQDSSNQETILAFAHETVEKLI